MKTIGRKIFYDVISGNVILDTGEFSGDVEETSFEEDAEIYKTLKERNLETFYYIQLEYGQFSQDFSESNGYRVNPETKELEFSYPNPNDPEVEQPYQEPLSEQVEELKQENVILRAQNNALSERADFIEDVFAEMAIQVYQ